MAKSQPVKNIPPIEIEQEDPDDADYNNNNFQDHDTIEVDAINW
jgi:hypothetical protein